MTHYLVTASFDQRMDMWAATATFSNWFEGRGPQDRQTWHVACVRECTDAFLGVARTLGVTVEEIQGAGDDERYVLLAGEPGTGWTAPAGKRRRRADAGAE